MRKVRVNVIIGIVMLLAAASEAINLSGTSIYLGRTNYFTTAGITMPFSQVGSLNSSAGIEISSVYQQSFFFIETTYPVWYNALVINSEYEFRDNMFFGASGKVIQWKEEKTFVRPMELIGAGFQVYAGLRRENISLSGGIEFIGLPSISYSYYPDIVIDRNFISLFIKTTFTI